MAALTPECYDGQCGMCDSDACGCDCHVDLDDGEEFGGCCPYCGELDEPCDCDLNCDED